MIVVLRIGHRYERDKRISTHIGLVARAFGADKLVIENCEREIIDKINNVTTRFGGDFRVEVVENWRDYIKNWKSTIVHLTMYGENINKVICKIPKNDLLIIVGAEKVPRDVYELADFNIAVGNQPHSEISALSTFLDRYFEGKELEKDFNGIVKIIPSKKGKNVVISKKFPDREECIKILRKVGNCEIVINHCIVVTELAVKIAKKAIENNFKVNLDLVEAGAMLHDIGRAKTENIDHGIVGGKIARELKLNKEIVNIIERHVGAGISKDNAVKLGLLPKDYIPKTLEEKIVAHADNLIANDKKQDIADACNKLFGNEKGEVAKKILMLHKELSNVCGIDLDKI